VLGLVDDRHGGQHHRVGGQLAQLGGQRGAGQVVAARFRPISVQPAQRLLRGVPAPRKAADARLVERGQGVGCEAGQHRLAGVGAHAAGDDHAAGAIAVEHRGHRLAHAGAQRLGHLIQPIERQQAAAVPQRVAQRGAELLGLQPAQVIQDLVAHGRGQHFGAAVGGQTV